MIPAGVAPTTPSHLAFSVGYILLMFVLLSPENQTLHFSFTRFLDHYSHTKELHHIKNRKYPFIVHSVCD